MNFQMKAGVEDAATSLLPLWADDDPLVTTDAAPWLIEPQKITHFDNMDGSGNMSGRALVLPVGGGTTWLSGASALATTITGGYAISASAGDRNVVFTQPNADWQACARFRVGAMDTDPAAVGIYLRFASASNYYRATLVLSVSSGNKFYIDKRVSNALTHMISVAVPELVAGQDYDMLFKVVGTTLTAALKRVGGTEKPLKLRTTSSSLSAAGYAGMHLFNSTTHRCFEFFGGGV